MKEIPVSDRVAFVDDEDYLEISKYTWCAHKGKGTWYAKRFERVGDKTITVRMHRQLLGITDSTIKVDHWNHNGLDNQKNNLRIASNQQNCQNTPKVTIPTSSRFKGVHWHKYHEKWEAQIMVGGKNKYLGSFEREEDAAIQYICAALYYFGEFATFDYVSC